ncbi:MAG: ATP-binding cassette domain-containing protein [Pseudomonadota bacterium]
MTATLDKAHVVRSGRAILNRASSACLPGMFTALCGPNGAGKTTALRVMTGSLVADEGRALLDGTDIDKIKNVELARRRAVVSQTSALSFPFRVHEVVTMGRAPHFGQPGQQRDDAVVAEAIEAMQLAPFVERNYLTLSGGEKKRVDIARSLAQIWDAPPSGQSRWLFLDEPTNALDLKYQIELMRRLAGLAADGWGIVAVLHDLHLVHEYADDIWLFKDGSIIATGHTKDILTPQSIQDTYELDAPYTLT